MRDLKADIKGILAAVLLLAMLLPSLALAAGEKVSFNFVDVDITAVAKFVSDVTGKNFIYDDRVRGKVTIIAPTKISVDDAYDLFTSVIQLKGYAIVPSGIGVYKIVPVAEARQSGLKVTDKKIRKNEDFIARLIPIEHISASAALKFLQPVISRNGYISSFGPGNLLLLMDSGLVIEKVLKIVDAIDKPFEAEEPEVVYLENSDAEEVGRVLNEGIQKNAQSRGVKPSAKAVPVKRINALVLFGSRAERASLMKLIRSLDVEQKSERGVINVYFLENADAEELGGVLKSLLGGGGKGAKGSSPFLSLSGASVTPDKGTNSLVIVASPSDYSSLEGVIKQLDRKRRQVYVEALIVEASIDKLRDLGSKWRGVITKDGEPILAGGVGNMDNETMQGIITGLSGLTVGGAGNYQNFQYPDPTNPGKMLDLSVPGFAALFSLSEFQGAVDILSSPQILTADNSEAEIHVGENVPFITKTETNTSGLATKSIQRQDVGIKLRITPQITEGSNVRLDIYQEISSVKVDAASSVAALEVGPTTTIRSTKTSVIVSNAQTVVISGLMQEREEVSETRVPLLHRIPILGWLFKYRSTSKLKTNLLLFLTPHIIRDAEDLRKITEQKSDLMARKEEMTVKGHMVVHFQPGISEDLAIAILSEKELVLIHRTDDEGYFVRLPKGVDIKKGAKMFKKVNEFDRVEPFYRMKTIE